MMRSRWPNYSFIGRICWRAFDTDLQRIIAVKIPKRTAAGTAEAFLAEARRVARLKHSAILPVYDVGLDAGECYFVTEYVEGGSLADRLRKGRIPTAQACRWIVSIADALDHAHRLGIVHRDVKPANILIDAHDRALLADFGIAQSALIEGPCPASVGTLLYMAPEQLAGQTAVPQSDIYSLAVVLHEALAGKPPYSATEPRALHREIEGGATLSKDVPNRLAPACRKALYKDPGQRFGSDGNYSYHVIGKVPANHGNAAVTLNPRRPIGCVSWTSAARFCNWLHNGQGDGSTETGAYALNGMRDQRVPREHDARFFLPNEDEWYKAAYYDPAAGTGGGYWAFATRSNDTPHRWKALGEAQLDRTSLELPNIANWGWGNGAWDTLAPVDMFPNATSAYGCHCMSGNLAEWVEPKGTFSHGHGIIRGGFWWEGTPPPNSGYRVRGLVDKANRQFGFRIAAKKRPTLPD